VDTSRDFHLRVMEDPEFRAGAIEIQWLERRLADLTHRKPPAEGVIRAAIAAVLLAERERSAPHRATPAVANDAIPGPASDSWLRAARIEGLR
jgi:acetyl/propionyl-CoA carboxylase alpha subunit